MTTSRDEAQRSISLAADDLAAFQALADLSHIRQALAFFHAQQAIEKSLKAVLFAQGMEFRKTHDLYELADRLIKSGLVLPVSLDAVIQVNPYAVEFRYGDETIPSLSREEVETIATEILNWATRIVVGVAG